MGKDYDVDWIHFQGIERDSKRVLCECRSCKKSHKAGKKNRISWGVSKRKIWKEKEEALSWRSFFDAFCKENVLGLCFIHGTRNSCPNLRDDKQSEYKAMLKQHLSTDLEKVQATGEPIFELDFALCHVFEMIKKYFEDNGVSRTIGLAWLFTRSESHAKSMDNLKRQTAKNGMHDGVKYDWSSYSNVVQRWKNSRKLQKFHRFNAQTSSGCHQSQR